MCPWAGQEAGCKVKAYSIPEGTCTGSGRRAGWDKFDITEFCTKELEKIATDRKFRKTSIFKVFLQSFFSSHLHFQRKINTREEGTIWVFSMRFRSQKKNSFLKSSFFFSCSYFLQQQQQKSKHDFFFVCENT